MGSYSVLIKMVHLRGELVPPVNYVGSTPCSKQQAFEMLSRIYAKAECCYTQNKWKTKLSEAFQATMSWIEETGANNYNPEKERVFRREFAYNGYAYRIDIEVLEGDGHFAN